jgi:hypothetical protein
MKQLKISIPDDLRSQLDAASESSGQSLAEEIRLRLERTFYQDTFDQRTRDLSYDVMRLADQVRDHIGQPWHSSRQAHEALEIALQTFLATIKPPSSKAAPPANAPFDPPTLGRAIATSYVHAAGASDMARRLMRGERPSYEKEKP